MTRGITVTSKVHFGTGSWSRKELRTGEEPKRPAGRVPRVARLLALAHRFAGLVRDGVVADYAELARLGHITRARMTQIMRLLDLAPDIQQAILFLPPVESGKDPVTERELRAIVVELDWRTQRRKCESVLRSR